MTQQVKAATDRPQESHGEREPLLQVTLGPVPTYVCLLHKITKYVKVKFLIKLTTF